MKSLSARLSSIWTSPFIFLLVLGLGSCGGGQTAVPTPPPTVTPPPALVIFPTPPSGWKVHTTPTFQIALPETWQQVALTEEGLRSAVKQYQATNPALGKGLQDLADSEQSKNLIFYAADAKAAGVIPHVTVTHTAPAGETRSEDLAKEDAEALSKNVPGLAIVSTSALVSVNGIDTAEVQYSLKLAGPAGQPGSLRGVQLLFLVSPQDLYIVTITGDGGNDEFVALAEQIAKSFVAVKRQ